MTELTLYHFVRSLLFAFVGAVTFSKLLELILCSIVPIIRNGSVWREDFDSSLASEKTWAEVRATLKNYNPYAISERLYHRLPPRWRRLLHSWHLLFVTLALLYYRTLHQGYRHFALILALTLLVVVLTQRVLSRVHLGVGDIATSGYKRIVSKSQVIGALGSKFLADMLISGLGFGLLYSGLERSDMRLINPVDVQLEWTEGIFFSFVTMTTTGYGDIYPVARPALLLVWLQLVFVWVLATVVALHYTTTSVTLSRKSFDRPGDDPADEES